MSAAVSNLPGGDESLGKAAESSTAVVNTGAVLTRLGRMCSIRQAWRVLVVGAVSSVAGCGRAVVRSCSCWSGCDRAWPACSSLQPVSVDLFPCLRGSRSLPATCSSAAVQRTGTSAVWGDSVRELSRVLVCWQPGRCRTAGGGLLPEGLGEGCPPAEHGAVAGAELCCLPASSWRWCSRTC